jgi:hypothetical protein
MKLLHIVEPFHQRWNKRDSFPGLHSDSRHLQCIIVCTYASATIDRIESERINTETLKLSRSVGEDRDSGACGLVGALISSQRHYKDFASTANCSTVATSPCRGSGAGLIVFKGLPVEILESHQSSQSKSLVYSAGNIIITHTRTTTAHTHWYRTTPGTSTSAKATEKQETLWGDADVVITERHQMLLRTVQNHHYTGQ